MTDQGGRLLMTLPALACPVLIISGSSRRPRWPLSAWRVLQPANVQCYQALSCATQLVMAVQWWPGLMNADWCSCALPKCSDSHHRLSFSLFGQLQPGYNCQQNSFRLVQMTWFKVRIFSHERSCLCFCDFGRIIIINRQ